MEKSYNFKISVSLNSFLFLLPFGIIIFFKFLESTMFPIISIWNYIEYLCLIAIVIKIFLERSYRVEEVMVSALFLVLGSLNYIKTGDLEIVKLIVIILGAYKIPVRKILATYLSISIFLMLVTVISSQIGLIENLIYYNRDTLRISFGFIYPTNFAAHIFYIYLAVCTYFRYDYKFLKIVLGCLLAFITFKYAGARLDSGTILLTMIFFTFIDLKLFSSKRILNIFSYSFIVMFVLAYAFSLYYGGGSVLVKNLDLIFSNRLRLSYEAITDYGISWWGRTIQFNGLGGTTKTVSNYNYVDSSYIRLLLLKGWVFTLSFITYLTIFLKKAVKEKKSIILIVFFLIALNSMIAQHLLGIAYNVFIITLLADYSDVYTYKSFEGVINEFFSNQRRKQLY
ncbi:TPA: hypothetical protein ACGOXY_000610 [Streptococcus suis]